MCCGRTNQTIPNRVTPTAPAPRPNPSPRGPAVSPKPVFEYTGATALTVVSPVTRKTYRFAEPGARIEIDPRDRPWVAFVPNLIKV